MNFKLTIGDWSGDGHGHSEDFEIETSGDLEETRRLYLEARASSDVHPENVCSDYEDPCLSNKQLESLGVTAKDAGLELQDADPDYYLSAADMARLWVAWMNHKTSARFVIIEIPALHWYGFRPITAADAEDHIGFIGYASSFACQLTAEVGAHWLSEQFLGKLALPSVDEMNEEIDLAHSWANLNLPNRGTEGFIGPYISNYVDDLIVDMGLNTRRTDSFVREYLTVFRASRFAGLADERRRSQDAVAP